MTKHCNRAWLLFLPVLLLPACSSTPASSTANPSYIRLPSGPERPGAASRTLPTAAVAHPSSPRTGATSTLAGMDAGMRQVESLAQVPGSFPWKYVVVHHSASTTGDADSFGRAHKQRGWDGLGYHFVIGNGSGSGDGEIEVGYRWRRQAQGAHAGSDLYNRYGVGICLVGNFERSRPTTRQLDSLERLIAYLTVRYRIPTANVIEHGNVRQTACPGRNFPFIALMEGVGRYQRQLVPAAVAAGKTPGAVGQ